MLRTNSPVVFHTDIPAVLFLCALSVRRTDIPAAEFRSEFLISSGDGAEVAAILGSDECGFRRPVSVYRRPIRFQG